MKRPLALIGLAYFLSLALTGSFDLSLTLIVSGLFFLATLTVLLYRPREERFQDLRKSLSAVLLTVGIGCCVSCACRLTILAPADALAGQECKLTGVVMDNIPEKGPYCARLVRVETLSDSLEYNGKYLRVLGAHLYEAELGERIHIPIRLEKLSDAYDSASCRSALSQGIRAVAFSTGEPAFSESRSSSFWIRMETALAVWKNAVASRIRAAVPGENGKLAAAVAVGDKSALSQKTLDDFRITGTRHLLALSGFHLSLLGSFLLSAGLFVAIPRKICYTIVILLTLGYMALVGFPYSLQRAGIMTVLTLVASLIRRSSDPINSLGASVLFICLLQPWAAYDTGLQLSVACTFGILLLAAPMTRALLRHIPQPQPQRKLLTFLRLFLNQTVRSLCTSLAASVFSFPILILTFGEVSLIGPLATLLAGWLLPFIMIPSLLAGLLHGIPWICAVFGWIADVAGTVTRWIIGALADIPFVCAYLKRPYVFCWLIGAGTGIALLQLLRTRKNIRRIFLLSSAVILLAASLLDGVLRKNTLEVSLIDDSALHGILLAEGKSALYAGSLSSNEDVYNLESMRTGQTLDTVCLLNPDNRALQKAKSAFPDAALIVVESGDAETWTLGQGKLYLLSDAEGHVGVYYQGTADILLLTDGFRAAELPTGAFHPDLLVLLGEVEQIDLLQPDAAYLSGEKSYQQSILLRAKGVQIPDAYEEKRMLRATSRGAEWRFSFEAL